MAICREFVDLGHTTEPSLKIGKYIATTRPLMSTPKITMINGFISDDSAATVSSTSSSKELVTLHSMPSSEPDSLPIHWRCQV